jgi:hypothetical protein
MEAKHALAEFEGFSNDSSLPIDAPRMSFDIYPMAFSSVYVGFLRHSDSDPPIFGFQASLLILQIERFTDAGEKVPNAARTSPISRSATHPKLNLSMSPVPLLRWDDARSISPGELQIARMWIGQLLFLNASVGCRSSEFPGTDVGIIFHSPICLAFFVDYFRSVV